MQAYLLVFLPLLMLKEEGMDLLPGKTVNQPPGDNGAAAVFRKQEHSGNQARQEITIFPIPAAFPRKELKEFFPETEETTTALFNKEI